MNKAELVDALATHFDGSRADAARALNAFVHTVSTATAAGERVAITGFGVFERVERPARTVRNPRTGERLEVEATAVPRFRPGTELKAYVSGQRPVPELSTVTPAAPRRPAAATAAPAEAPVAATVDEPAASAPAQEKGKAKDSKAKPEPKPSGKSKPSKSKDKDKDKAKDTKADKDAAKKGKAKGKKK